MKRFLLSRKSYVWPPPPPPPYDKHDYWVTNTGAQLVTNNGDRLVFRTHVPDLTSYFTDSGNNTMVDNDGNNLIFS